MMRTTCLATRPPGRAFFLVLLVLLLWGCDYARMRDDEAFQTYQTAMPVMPEHAVPTTGGQEALALADPEQLVNPLPLNAESAETGKWRYGSYCIQCHGPDADGEGTVGQSFYPLPTNLKSPQVQNQSDGELFLKISFGYKRHPPLGYTVQPMNRWAIICYIRALGR